MSYQSRIVAWAVLALCICGVASVVVVRTFSEKGSRLWQGNDPGSAMTAGVAGDSRTTTDVVLVSLLPSGFEPSEITHPEGKFLFGVNNRTGLSDLRFQLNHETGRTVSEKRMVKDRIWRKAVDLKPGRYVLRVADHPDWRCEITITPR